MSASSTADPTRAAAVEARLSAALVERVAAYAPSGALGGSATLIACDVDRTLVYSAAALMLAGPDEDAPELVVAEVRRGLPRAYLTADARQLLAVLATKASLVPVTTRTQEQYERVRLGATPPAFAVTSNGGRLLVEGRLDLDWSGQVAKQLADLSVPLAEVRTHLKEVARETWVRHRRVADDLFAYLDVERDEMPAGFVAELEEWCGRRGWAVSVQGRKVYAVPSALTKSAAVREVASRVGADRLVAAGDSRLDAELLESADVSFRPAHGELNETGWQCPGLTVTQARGVLAGEEIIARILALVLTA
ncbi:MAG: hypothetical protein ACRDP1_06035 [Nocardioidaceae bacterium]